MKNAKLNFNPKGSSFKDISKREMRKRQNRESFRNAGKEKFVRGKKLRR